MRLLKFKSFNESSHQEEIDRILDKISSSGIKSLSKIEKEILDNFENKEKLGDIISRNKIKIKGAEFKFTIDKCEIYGEEFRVWGNLEFLDINLYGFLEGYPMEVGGDDFEAYVFTTKNDLRYGMDQEEIEIPSRFHLHDLLERKLGFLDIDHEIIYDFFSRIWDLEKSVNWNMESVIEWFRERGVRYP